MIKTIHGPQQTANYNGKGTVTVTSFKTFAPIGGILCLQQSNPSLKLFSGEIHNIKIIQSILVFLLSKFIQGYGIKNFLA